MGDIQSNEVQLWLVEDQQITEQSLLDEYKALLNAEEQTRYERLNFPKHQRQFLVSRALLRTVLGKYLQRPPESLVFARNAYGKPRIASFEKPLPISFNLSHTNGLSVLAVTPGDDLGVDVEYLTRKVDILKLAQRFFSKQEYVVADSDRCSPDTGFCPTCVYLFPSFKIQAKQYSTSVDKIGMAVVSQRGSEG